MKHAKTSKGSVKTFKGSVRIRCGICGRRFSVPKTAPNDKGRNSSGLCGKCHKAGKFKEWMNQLDEEMDSIGHTKHIKYRMDDTRRIFRKNETAER